MGKQSAGLAPRALAMGIDAVLLALVSALLMWLVYGKPVARWDDLRPASVAINWLLPLALCLLFWTWQGATPGKLVAGVQVVDARSGGRPTLLQALLRWLGYFVSALPLFAGFWWARVDAEGRTWHDRLSRTAVQRSRPAPADGRGFLADYIVSHWRGEQGLAQSYWINNVLLSYPLLGGITGLMSWISTKGEALQAGSIAVLIGWPLLLVVQTWSLVGAWRAVRGYLDIGGSLIWAALARLLLFLAALQILASLFIGFVPRAGDYWQMARGIDPIGSAELRISEDGRILVLNGPIGMGDATRLGQLLAGAPSVKLIELASPGGRVIEAERMVELVRQRGGHTRAVGNCESACTLVFLAGSHRQLMPGAQLGFHRASTGTFNAAFDEIANQELARTYRRMQLPEEFIRQALSTPPHRMWYPKSQELVRHALIADPPKTLDIALPDGHKPGEPAPLSDYVQALRANPAWYVLGQQIPGLIDDAAGRMRAARLALAGTPGEVDGAQMAAQMALAPHVRRLLLSGSADLRRRYLQVVRAQLTAAQALGKEACQSWLAGSPVPRRLLPAQVMAWEAAWLTDAADEVMDDPKREQPTRLELEVVHRTLGAYAPGMLSRLWRDEADPASSVTCERTALVLDQLPRTAPGPRELAERMVFQSMR